MAQQKIKENVTAFRRTVATAIAAAFGFVLALSWNNLINSSVNELIGALNIGGGGLTYKLIATIIITLICVLAIVRVSKWSK